ncbi:MAG TPA: serine hydrolase [Hyphomicrobiaceae bacterium]|nr:serine hydrolase [Hyphomicrobiaceae bacterium]
MSEQVMAGFPPRPDTQVTLANWRTAPFNRWAFHHVRELLPTADIPHDAANVRELPARAAFLEGVRIPGTGAKALTIDQALKATSTDGLVVLHRGAIVLERYFNGMSERSPHIFMSVTKSMLGLLAGILAGHGILNVSQLVTDVIPELKATAWEGATVMQLLDMRTGVAFNEDYLATSGPMIAYRKAVGWNPPEPGEQPTDLRSFFSQLTQSDGHHGGRFWYVSPNTDLLGWIIERVSGRRYADLMSELLWQPMGAAANAYITVDRLGAPRTAGGMCATTQDLARVGQMLVEGGFYRSRQVVPPSWIDMIVNDGDREAWSAGNLASYYPGVPIHYRAKWYVERGESPVLFCLGIHGQNLFVDTKNEIVIAKFSSQPQALDVECIGLTGMLVGALRTMLG